MRKATSPFNPSIKPDKPLVFADSTLREGALNPGASFTYEESKELIRALDAIGVSTFTAAAVGANREPDKQLTKFLDEVKQMDLRIGMSFLTSDKKAVDYVVPFEPYDTSVVAFTSEYLNRGQPMTDEIFEKNMYGYCDLVSYIRSKGINPHVGLCDSTRAREDRVFRMAEELAKAGASTIMVVDTAGCALPEAINYLVKNIKEIVEPYGIRVGIHCHNDFGLANANILAGVAAGATYIDTCVNGLGDRSGNGSLACVAAALELLYGVKTGLDLKQLKTLSKLASRLSGVPMLGNTPLVGDYSFSHIQNVHIVEYEREPLAWQGIMSEEVGNETMVVFGKESGNDCIRFESERVGRRIDPKLYPAILERLTMEADTHKGQIIMSEQFWKLVDEIEETIHEE